MSRTMFTDFSPITADFLNAVGKPQITGLNEDGHLDLLTNANFQNTPGNVVYDFYQYIDAMLGHADDSGGLNFYIHGFRFLRPNGEVMTVPEQTVTLFNNAVNYVWYDQGGEVKVTLEPPTEYSIQSAKVTTGSGSILSTEDLRYDFVSLPRLDRYPVFGGSQTSSVGDFVATNNQVVGGLIECRNFTVPLGVTLYLDNDTTVRASGNVLINGTVRTNIVQGGNAISRSNTIGGGPNFQHAFPVLPDAPDPLGTPVVSRTLKKSRAGGSSLLCVVLNAGATQGLFVTINISQTTLPYLNAVDGKHFTVHCGGSITLGPASVIDLRGLDSSAPTPGSWFSSSFPSGGLAPNFLWIVQAISSSCVPGNAVLQAIQKIEVQGNASINCNGGSEGWGVSAGNSLGTLAQVLPGVNPYTYKGTVLAGGGYFKYGASGGGGIFMRSPIIVSSITATYSVAPGTMGTYNASTNLYINGPGAVGDGYQQTGNVPPTAGTIQQIIGAPVEF